MYNKGFKGVIVLESKKVANTCARNAQRQRKDLKINNKTVKTNDDKITNTIANTKTRGGSEVVKRDGLKIRSLSGFKGSNPFPLRGEINSE